MKKHFSELNDDELRDRIENLQGSQAAAMSSFDSEAVIEVKNTNRLVRASVGSHGQNDRGKLAWFDCASCGHKLSGYVKTCGACNQPVRRIISP